MAGKKRQSGKYEADLVKTYHQVSGKKKKKKAGKKIFSTILIVLIVAVFLAAIGGGTYLYFFSGVTPGLILNNVSVLNIHIGGMTREEATAYLQKTFESSYCANKMTLILQGKTMEITAEQAGLSLDAAAAVEKAYELGRAGTQAQRKIEQMQAVAGKLPLDAAPYLTVDTAALRQQVDAFCDQFPTQPTEARWELVGTVPDLATEEMPEAELSLMVYAGTPGYEIDRDSLTNKLLQAYLDCAFEIAVSSKILEPTFVDLETVAQDICLAPVDALMDTETFEVSNHAYGYHFDPASAQALVDELSYGGQVAIPLHFVAPANTKESLESILFRDVLATYTAKATSRPGGRDVNLKLACEKLNGIVLMPGDIFSYNPALGERTAANGWKLADSYEGGATVQTLGGGICQPSSCLYLCALLADLEIVERSNHSYVSSYVPFGMDATVSWGGPEFRFKNSSDYPIRIEASANKGSVTISLIGTDTKDYYTKITYEILSVDEYETVYEEMPADNDEGYQDGDVIVSGYTGYTVQTYQSKYNKETDELISTEKEARSIYKRRDKVVCKILQEETEPSTEESTESSSESTL